MRGDRDWTADAACRGVDPEVFFPVAAGGTALAEEVAAAKAICARCPVSAECLEWAVEVGEAYGVWGGTTPHERRYLRRGQPMRDEGLGPVPDPMALASPI